MKYIIKIIIVFILLVMGNSVKAEGKYRSIDEVLENLQSKKTVYIYTHDNQKFNGRVYKKSNNTLCVYTTWNKNFLQFSDISSIESRKTYANLGALAGFFVGAFVGGKLINTSSNQSSLSYGEAFEKFFYEVLITIGGIELGYALGGVVQERNVLYEDSKSQEARVLSFNIKPDLKGGAVLSATVSF